MHIHLCYSCNDAIAFSEAVFSFSAIIDQKMVLFLLCSVIITTSYETKIALLKLKTRKYCNPIDTALYGLKILSQITNLSRELSSFSCANVLSKNMNKYEVFGVVSELGSFLAGISPPN